MRHPAERADEGGEGEDDGEGGDLDGHARNLVVRRRGFVARPPDPPSSGRTIQASNSRSRKAYRGAVGSSSCLKYA